MKPSFRVVSIFFVALFLISCGILGSKDKTPTYTVKATASPAAGGTVSPDSASYEEGKMATVQATANTGYRFDGWSGGQTSDENPLEFEVTQNTNVTANFTQLNSRYDVSLTVEDADNAMTLKFGQQLGATADFDNGTDKESPPPPPDGALHSYFSGANNDLLWDYRSNTAAQATWTLNYQVGTGSTLHLSWTINSTVKEGSLTISTGGGSADVDMDSQSSVDVTVPSSGSGSVTIEYTLGN